MEYWQYKYDNFITYQWCHILKNVGILVRNFASGLASVKQIFEHFKCLWWFFTIFKKNKSHYYVVHCIISQCTVIRLMEWWLMDYGKPKAYTSESSVVCVCVLLLLLMVICNSQLTKHLFSSLSQTPVSIQSLICQKCAQVS